MQNDNFLMTTANVKMPKILYGTAWKQEQTARLVEQAITLGFRGIDTACQPKHYNERGVGEGTSACIQRGIVNRCELYLQTKFTPADGHDPKRIPYDPNAELSDQVAQSVQASLNNLQTSYLDCLILHSPYQNREQTYKVWRAMENQVNSGTVKQLGLSNCYDLKAFAKLVEFALAKPTVLQNRFYAATGHDKNLRAYCKEHGIVYQSFWTLTANPNLLAHPKLQALSEHHQRTAAQILFRFLTQIGIVPLTGTTSETHMLEDLAIFDFELQAEECQTIDGLLA